MGNARNESPPDILQTDLVLEHTSISGGFSMPIRVDTWDRKGYALLWIAAVLD